MGVVGKAGSLVLSFDGSFKFPKTELNHVEIHQCVVIVFLEVRDCRRLLEAFELDVAVVANQKKDVASGVGHQESCVGLQATAV